MRSHFFHPAHRLSCFLLATISAITTTASPSFDSPNIPLEQLTCRPTGLIQDTSCDYETVDEVNRKLHSALSEAVQLPIFRYHKVDLYRQCPFWSEDGLCGNRACAVNELNQDDVPAYWRSSELSDLKTTAANDLPIDLANKCVVREQDYCVLDDTNGVPSNGVYVDLLANPERFTGYSGKSAQRVWRAIYEENCFNIPPRLPSSPFSVPPPSAYAGLETKPEGALEEGRKEESCLEKRVYYKLLSGLHASISMHICDEYLDPNTGRWVPNLQCYLNRIGLYPERLQNLYFAYTLMLRALSRSASYLSSPRVELCTGDPKADSLTRTVLDRLITTAHAYPVTFDETSMFKGASAKKVKEEFKAHFRNVSRIMDCVGCDKCRLWGKLQFMGLGTGLKLLFEYEEGDSNRPDFNLTRPELIAFINTLNRLSESLEAVEKFRKLWQQRDSEGTLPVRVQDEKFDALASGRAAKAIALSPGLGPRVDSAWMAVSPAFEAAQKKDHNQTPADEVIRIEKDQELKVAAVEENPTRKENHDQKVDSATEPSRKKEKPELNLNAVTEASRKVMPGMKASPATEPWRKTQPTVVEQHRQTHTQPPTPIAPQPQAGPSGVVYRSSALNRSDASVRPNKKYQVGVELGTFIRPATRFLKLVTERCRNSVVVCTQWMEGLLGHMKKSMIFVVSHRHDSGGADVRVNNEDDDHGHRRHRSGGEKEL